MFVFNNIFDIPNFCSAYFDSLSTHPLIHYTPARYSPILIVFVKNALLVADFSGICINTYHTVIISTVETNTG